MDPTRSQDPGQVRVLSVALTIVPDSCSLFMLAGIKPAASPRPPVLNISDDELSVH